MQCSQKFYSAVFIVTMDSSAEDQQPKLSSLTEIIVSKKDSLDWFTLPLGRRESVTLEEHCNFLMDEFSFKASKFNLSGQAAIRFSVTGSKLTDEMPRRIVEVLFVIPLGNNETWKGKYKGTTAFLELGPPRSSEQPVAVRNENNKSCKKVTRRKIPEVCFSLLGYPQQKSCVC